MQAEQTTDKLTQLGDKLAQTASWALDKIQQGGDWAQNAIPSAGSDLGKLLQETAQQFVLYHAIVGWTMVAVSIILAFVFWAVGKRGRKIYTETGQEFGGFLQAVAGVGWVASAIIFFVNIGDAIKATFAPKYFIIEYLMEYLKARHG